MRRLLDEAPAAAEGVLPLDVKVAPGGYAWWYLDVVSDDHDWSLTAIAFVGSAFSPAYARARARGEADPEAFCALNLAVRGPGIRAWVMTEWPRGRVHRDPERFTLGTSVWRRQGRGVALSVDEMTSPFPDPRRGRVVGTVTLQPSAPGGAPRGLDPGHEHRWYPHAPAARAWVELEQPRVRFAGSAYHDANAGDAPLADGFRRWSWSRLSRGGDTVVTYDLEPRRGEPSRFALRFGPGGETPSMVGPVHRLPRTGWGLRRQLCWPGAGGLGRTLESAPFYARSHVWGLAPADESRWSGVHEELDLDRFRAPWVQVLLPFRTRLVRP